MSNENVRINGHPMVNVLGGKYVSRSNPLPVEVVGGSVGGGGSSGGADMSLPTDANGNVLMNLNAIGTSQSLGVKLDSVASDVTVPVDIGSPSVIIKSAESALPISGSVGITGTPTVNVGNTTAIKTSISNTPDVNVTNSSLNVNVQGNPECKFAGLASGISNVPTLDTGAYNLAVQNATFISGSGYNKAWNSASPGFQPLFTANNQRVRLLGVASEPNQIFAFQKPNVFTIYFPCNVVIDLIGLQNGSFNGSATEGFCSVVNSNTVGILLMYWVYS
jgi:hypothetical protein